MEKNCYFFPIVSYNELVGLMTLEKTMGPSYFFDKSELPEELKLRQKDKGTFDSPCLSVCDYEGEESICQTCKMKKSEKVSWKISDDVKKEILALKILKRRA